MVFVISYYAVYSHKVKGDSCKYSSFRDISNARNLNDANKVAKSKYPAAFQFDETKLNFVVEERSKLVSLCR